MKTSPVVLRQIAADGDNNAFFPSPGGGKIQFVCNLWSGKNSSPSYYGEIGISES